MTALDYALRLKMAICERQGGHRYVPEGVTMLEPELLVDGRIETVHIAVATEECACGRGRAVLWPVREDGTGPTLR